MKPDILTLQAQRARDRYELLLAGLRGAASSAMRDMPPGSERARQAVRTEVYDLAQRFLADERPIFEDELLAQALDAVLTLDRSVGMPETGSPRLAEDMDEDILAHLADLADELEQALRLQVERDISLVMRSLRDTALTGALRKRRGGAADTRGGAGAQDTQGALSALVFEFVDRSNKRWPSPRHVATLWRHAHVLAWSEVALLRASQIGLPVLQVDHPDASYTNTGVLVAIEEDLEEFDGEETIPWLEVRREVFHPNSVAWLRPVDAALVSQA